MQTSITSFFKTKPLPAKANIAESTVNLDSDDEVVIEKSTKQNSKISIKSPPIKRLVVSDSEDDEVVLPPPRSRQRLALESPESSPIKTTTKSVKDDEARQIENIEVNSDKDGSGDEIVEKKSPKKTTGAVSIASPLMQQSLLNLDEIIKKKISNGAFALHDNIGHTWFRALSAEFDKPYFKKLSNFIKAQRESKTVFPPADQVFTWTHYHPIRDTRVVIIGQDPYHGPNMAHGLSFSVQKGIAVPKSLQNIYKELQSDIPGFKAPAHGNLTGWSKQGVLLLNACLTVNRSEANSHQGKGWENFTDAVISWISKNCNHNVVFILWGKFAQKKSTLIDKRHKILSSAHPSPFSADSGFFGSKPFSQTNAYLRSQKLPEIDWAAL